MSGVNLQERISLALSAVRNNRLGLNVLEAEMVRDIATTTDGKVRFTLLLAPSDDAELVRQARQAVEAIGGVTDVHVDVKDASAARASAPRKLPVMGQEPAARRVPPAPTPVTYPNLGRIIAVSSGKGGVGKSTVAVNTAVALAQLGARVGLMDADIYGPNVPRMLGVNAPPEVEREKIVPLQAHGVSVISLGFMIERDQPAIWRGPIIMKIVTQFLRDVAWGELDFLIVDMPPGTGDAQLSLVQATRVSGVLIVTTPQDVATGDALRGARMFERVDVPVLGVIENMSSFACPHCNTVTQLFSVGGGARLAAEVGVPLLASVPIYPGVMQGGETGQPIVVAEPDSEPARAFRTIASDLLALRHSAPSASPQAEVSAG